MHGEKNLKVCKIKKLGKINITLSKTRERKGLGEGNVVEEWRGEVREGWKAAKGGGSKLWGSSILHGGWARAGCIGKRQPSARAGKKV